MSEVRGSLEDAEKAIEAAVQAGHKFAELKSRLTAARTLYEMGDLDAAETHILFGLELADHLGANRFKPFFKIYLGKIQLARNESREKTFDILQNALKISRNTGIGFVGPWVLSTLALVMDDKKAALAALDEGEEILKSGCVGHNYFDFYRNAMEVAWRYGDTELIERYANALEEYITGEPLPWAQYYIMWGRALADHQRKPNNETAEGLRLVKNEAERLELLASILTLDQALNNH
jgi:tetratricopeptide (TPR) repeat protein